MDVAGKKLVAKVDAKNKLLLDNYKEEETRKLSTNNNNNDNYNSEEKKEDDSVLSSISQILIDHRNDIENFETIQEGNYINKIFKNYETILN